MFRYTQFTANNRDLKAILYENWLSPRYVWFLKRQVSVIVLLRSLYLGDQTIHCQ
jgi:hypothetical protein